MNQTMLISLSHQMAAYQAMDSIANNIANVSTPGFKRESPTFQEFVARVKPSEGEKGSQKVSYVQETGVVRDMTEGPMQATGGKFDFAIHGNGYFAIQTANGERYTRNGHFTLDLNGKLSTEGGDEVETQGGALSITPQDSDVNVSQETGLVSATINGTQSQLGKLKVVDFRQRCRAAKGRRQPLFDHAGRERSREGERRPGNARILERAAGGRNLEHDRNHALLSGDDQSESDPAQPGDGFHRQTRPGGRLREYPCVL